MKRKNKKIGVVGIKGRWSSEKLSDAVAEKTGFHCLIEMEHVYLDMQTGKAWYKETDLSNLDALILKKIGSSYSVDCLDRLEILRFLNSRGLPIFSRPEKIIRLLDRLSCTTTLKLGGIPIPPTVITEDIDHALRTVDKFGLAVFKPLFTSKARGMHIIQSGRGALAKIKKFKDSGNPVMYIQKMVPIPGRDLGVVFLNGKYIGTYARRKPKDSWNTTTHSGGTYVSCEPDKEIIKLATKAQNLFGLDFTCVDCVETKQGPMVFEVSAFGGFRGLQHTCDIDAAGMLVDYVLEKI